MIILFETINNMFEAHRAKALDLEKRRKEKTDPKNYPNNVVLVQEYF